jgi:hypothetical protein
MSYRIYQSSRLQLLLRLLFPLHCAVEHAQQEVPHHRDYEGLPGQAQPALAPRLGLEELGLLPFDRGLEGRPQAGQDCVDCGEYLLEAAAQHEDDEKDLQVHLDDCLAERSGQQELVEGELEVSAEDAGHVEEGIRDGGQGHDCDEAVPLQVALDRQLASLDEGEVLLFVELDDVVGLVVLPRLRVGQGHEVGRQLTQSCPEAP